MPLEVSNRQFVICILSIGFLYVAIQFYYLTRMILTTDDFWLAFHIYQYKTAIPYRDFAPYKTVLGYYLYLLPMCLSRHTFKPLFYAKETAVLINVFFMLLISMRLRKFYSANAIIAALLLVSFSHLFLIYSAEIRVDLLAYWLCALSVVFIFEEKTILAGVLIALGFLVSQKAAWYIVATDIALLGFCISGINKLAVLKRIFFFNCAMLLTILTYIIFWSAFASLHTVLNSMFYEAYVVSISDFYHAFRRDYWVSLLQNNALFLMMWPLILFLRMNQRRIFLLIFALVLFLFLCSYKLLFPYGFTLLAPAFFLFYTDFFAGLNQLFTSSIKMRLPKRITALLILIYILLLIGINLEFGLDKINYLICLIPISLGGYLLVTDKQFQSALSTICVLPIIFLGIICPVIWSSTAVLSMDNHYQKSMLTLLNTLLADGGDYVAGVPLLYNKPQPIPGLKHLVGPGLYYLQQPSANLARVLLPSLYLDPVTSGEVIHFLQVNPVKLYVNNNRFRLLPLDIKNYLASQYQHFWGSIYLYAPAIKSGSNTTKIAFSGKYKLTSASVVQIDNRKILPNSMVYLSNGYHYSNSKSGYRLVLIPQHIAPYLNSKYQTDNWSSMAL